MTYLNRTASRFKDSGAALCLVLVCALNSGCSREFFRQRADEDAYRLIGQAAQDTTWSLPDYDVYVNPKSRMASPYSPDCPPMPPDDPESHGYMRCVDGKKGYFGWDKNGHTSYVDNPAWRAYLPVDKNGDIRLDSRGAVRMALLQSPDYQQQLEELYLSALDVSFEQFRFDTQFFGGYQAYFTSDGPDRATGRSSELALSTRTVQMNKMFATGGELMVGLANSLIWEFSGPDSHAAVTLLDFSFVQPLLRFGGRARVLERLTVAERALLANVRQMERFRRGFYTEIASGTDSGQGPSRRGGLQGGAGLEGFSGVGAGGFGRLGAIGAGGTGGIGGTGAAQAGGFLGLLQTVQELRNQEANVTALRNSLASLQARYDAGGRVDFFQVELARQALYNAQSRLLTSRTTFESSLDQFKINMGLPPDTPIVLDDPILDRFQLLDTGLANAQTETNELLTDVRDPDRMPSEDEWGGLLRRKDAIVERSQQFVAAVRSDMEKLRKVLPERRTILERFSKETVVQDGDLQKEPFDVELLKSNVEDAEKAFEEYAVRLRQLGDALDDVTELRQREQLATRLNKLSLSLQDLALLQARIRLETIQLVPVSMEPDNALNVARQHRRDWKNARASLVDSWRLIQFNANALKSDLNIVFNGDIGNTGDNPIRLQSTTGRLRAGIEFDAPLTRLVERNRYRQALIEYGQARRSYYTFTDRVSQSLRATLRNIELNQLNFEMRRAAVQLAISQVELARLQLEEPPKPGAVEQAGTDNRVQNLVNSLNELLSAQNDILSIWVTYEVLRLSLDFQLGTMQLDSEGIWIDPGPIQAATDAPMGDDSEETIPAPLPDDPE